MEVDISKYRNKAVTASGKKEKKEILSFLNKDISFFGTALGDKQKERFYSELYSLFLAGVDMKTALELLEEEQTKAKNKVLFTAIKEKVIKGSSLSKAMEESKKFSPYEFSSIRIGEESGRLKEVLQELNSYFTRKIKLKRQFISVFTYPVFVLVVSLGVVYFMLNNIVPMFSDVFQRFGSDLPGITKKVILLSENFSFYFYSFLAVIVLLGTLIAFQRKSTWYRKFSSALLLKLPVFGKIIRKIYIARFCQAMHLLTASHTPLTTAVELTRKMIGFYPVEESLKQVNKDLMKGISLHKAMGKHRIYDKRMVSLVKVSEEVNQLDVMFGKLSGQYSDEVEHQTGIIGTVIEPLMIILIALFVGFILIAMYLPMFQMSTSIG